MGGRDAEPVIGNAGSRAWGAAVILMVAYTLSWVDRSLPAILIEPMKASLGLSDTQLALLTGFAFAVCYATLAVPLSWVADRWDRAWLITMGVVVWSAMTLACGYVDDFPTLFVLRMGVGLGEAVLLPAAYSLIADLFSRQDRPKALMVLVLGSPLGWSLAFAGGGGLYRQFEISMPGILGDMEPWRATFVTVGITGFLVAALTACLPEPRRTPRGLARARVPDAGQAGTRSFVAYLRSAAFFLVPLVVGITLLNVFVNGFIAWLPSLFTRTYGWTLPTVGASLGAATLVAGIAGAPLGAAAAALIGSRRRRDAAVTVLTLCAACQIPFALLSALAPRGAIAFAGVCIGLVFTMAAGAVAPAAVINSAPSAMRARVSAVYLLIANLIGSGTGATLYAVVTDYVLRDPSKLNYSIAYVSTALLLGIVVALKVADRRYDQVMRLSGEEARA